MSFPVALLVSLFFSSFALAAVVAPDCGTNWNWSYNSLGQNPCLIVAYMMSTCNGGTFTVEPLAPGQNYIGPTGQDNSNLCKCSTIAYSLISACDGCQGSNWITWSQFVSNCTKTEPPGAFPNPIPAGTRLPQWALLDVTNENLWNPNKSSAVGANPELGSGTILGPSGPSTSSSTGATSSSSSTSSSSPTAVPPHGHSSNTGAIAGGVAGSVAGISILVAALFYYMRRRHPPTPHDPFAIDDQPSGFNPIMDQVPRSMSGPGTITSSVPDTTTTSVPRPYDPDDPTTYPTYQGPSPPPVYFNPYGPTAESPSGPFPSGKSPVTGAPATSAQGLGSGYTGLPEAS